MGSAHGLHARETAGDNLCLRFFTESGEFTDPELRGLCAWWSSARLPDEFLVPFLIRRQVFHPRAAEEIGLMERGYVSFSTIHHLFLPGGIDHLRRELQPHISPRPSPSFLTQTDGDVSNNDTVRMRGQKTELTRSAEAPKKPAPEPVPQIRYESKRNVDASNADGDEPATQLLSTLPIIRRRASNQPAPPLSELPIGTKLGPYELLNRIGRGSKGIVYEADDLFLNRRVAVKLLAPEMAGRGSAWPRRFLQEARLASRLSHPSILPIFAVGQDPGLVYYSMPFMSGGSTKDALRLHGPYAPIEATRIARQISRALMVAHSHGLSHGNLKPSNVFVGDDGEVKISDFTVPHLPLAGDHGLSAGDPVDDDYQSGAIPELRAQDIATDIRLLGATYHWLLTGKPPPDKDQDQLFPELPPACGRVVATALARNRGQRYASAAEASLALSEAEESLRAVETSDLPGFAVPDNARQQYRDQPDFLSGQPLHSAEAGQVLGKYLLIERVGQGSSGTVFRARHQTLNIPVAVKILNIAGQSGVYRQLKSEARLLAQLNHPSIVRVWDFEDDPAMPYLVMEYVEGLNVAELIHERGRLSPELALKIVAQVASGLEAAQKLGIVHRDVKPGNILLTRDANAKLADLGLAVFVDSDKGNASGPGLAGTVAYIPPEQASATGSVDHRSDIYALGASFYHMVTGQIPFQGASRMEVIRKHSHEALLPPHELVPGMPPALSDLIVKMMAKAADDRFQSYDELLRAIDEVKESPDSDVNGSPVPHTRGRADQVS